MQCFKSENGGKGSQWWSKSGGVASSHHPPSLCLQAMPLQRRMDARRILKGHVADEPRLLLVIQEERAVGNAADQMAALVGLEVAQRSHGAYYTIFHSTTTTPPLWSISAHRSRPRP